MLTESDTAGFISVGTPTPNQIRMVEISTALADADPDPADDYAFFINEDGTMRKVRPRSPRLAWIRFPRRDSVDPDAILKAEFDAGPTDPAAAGWTRLD